MQTEIELTDEFLDLVKGRRMLVAYSGGADSTCLLHLLSTKGLDVVAAHLHHGQRAEADDELDLCSKFANSIGVPFLSGRADVPLIAKTAKIGLEEAGRIARYHFFEQASRESEAEYVVTAHTRSDSVETILFNLARGSGATGLTGIQHERRNILRPLLHVSRHETRQYCKDRGLWFHNDPANDDLEFSRARIRHRVLPELKLLNPDVEVSISRAAALLSEEDQFLNSASAAALEQAELHPNGEHSFLTSDCEVVLSRAVLESLPAVLFRRAIRLVTRTLGGELDFQQTELVCRAVREQIEVGSVTCEGGEIVLEWTADRFHARQLRPVEPYRYKLTVPGETESEEFGWRFRSMLTERSTASQSRTAMTLEIDPSAIRGELFFRTAGQGDSMVPYGFDHPRKLSDLLGERKLTKAARTRLPIVCDMIGPIWIPGVCFAARVHPKESTTRVLVVEFGPIT